LGITGKKFETTTGVLKNEKRLPPSKIVIFFETPTHRIMPCNVPCNYKRKK
jgi:hypothetical protein